MNEPQKIYRETLRSYWRELTQIVMSKPTLTKPFETETRTIDDETCLIVTIFFSDKPSVKASRNEAALARMRWQQLTKQVMSKFVITRWFDSDLEHHENESILTINVWYPAEKEGEIAVMAGQKDDCTLKSVLQFNEDIKDV